MRFPFRFSQRYAPVWITGLLLSITSALAIATGWLNRQPTASIATGRIPRFNNWQQQLESYRKYDLFHRLELILFDLRVREAAQFAHPISTNLGVVVMTDQSVRKLAHGFPLGVPYGLSLPRHLYARVIRELSHQGAKSVALDIILADERPDHADVDWVEDKATNTISSDNALVRTFLKHGPVFIGTTTNIPPARSFRKSAAILGGVDSLRDIDDFARRVYAFTDCEYLSTGLLDYANSKNCDVEVSTNGSLQLVHLDSNEVEPLPLTSEGRFPRTLKSGAKVFQPASEKKRIWHMGIELAAQSLGLDLEHPVLEDGGVRLKGTNGVERFIPLDHDHSLMIHWTTPAPRIFSQSMDDLLALDVQREEDPTSIMEATWTNKLVVVGSTATGNNISDLGATPLATQDFLIATYINVADSLLQDRFIRRLPLLVEWVCELALGLLGAWVTLRRRIWIASLVVVAVAVGWIVLCFWLFIEYRLWVPMAHPLLSCLILHHAGLLTWRVVFEQKEQRRVRGIFSKIVSPDVVQELLRAEKHGLGGSRRKLTVFFADVRGFTEMTDRYQVAAEEHVRTQKLSGEAAEAYFEEQASEVLATVNTYLATIADQIKFHQGTLDKYIGDCVMAFWGAPIHEPKHSVRCVSAAMAAQRAIEKLNVERTAENGRREAQNAERAAQGLPPFSLLPILQLGTGINTGVMTVGLMGSEAHIMNYTVFGREVNLASRLEGVSGRSRIIIGEETYNELALHSPDLAQTCKPLEPVTVKGFRQAVRVFEVPWHETAAPQPDAAKA